jgi:hypothetical protein
MGVGRKKGQPDRSDTGTTGSVNYISCPGGCGTRVAENDGMCGTCRLKLSGTHYGTAGTGKDSCVKPIHPENKGEER